MFSRQPDRWYQLESAPCDRSVLIRISFVAKTGLDLTDEQALYVLMKRKVHANIKRQNYQSDVKNVILVSAKTVSSDIILVVNRKGN